MRVKKWGSHSIIGVDMHPHVSVVESILAESCAPVLPRVQGPVSCEKRNKIIGHMETKTTGFPGGSVVKNLPANAREEGDGG